MARKTRKFPGPPLRDVARTVPIPIRDAVLEPIRHVAESKPKRGTLGIPKQAFEVGAGLAEKKARSSPSLIEAGLWHQTARNLRAGAREAGTSDYLVQHGVRNSEKDGRFEASRRGGDVARRWAKSALSGVPPRGRR